MTEKKVYVEDILPLVEKFSGNISAIARHFKVSRQTIHNRMSESVQLANAMRDAKETMKDNVESQLYAKALGGDNTAMIFFLKTQAKDRGYTERHELTGAEGNEIVFRVVRE